MDKLEELRKSFKEEKTQTPNLVRPSSARSGLNGWRDIVTNPDSAPTIPGSSVVKIEPTVTTPSKYWWWVGGLPDASSLPYGEVGITMPTPDILASGTGKLVTVWPALCRVNGSPSVGDKLGTINGSFLLQTGKTGFTVVAVNAGGVWVVPEGGGGGGGVGVQGPQGDHGLNGNNGVQGSVGPQGDQGDEGIPGEVGPQGDQGDPGGPQGFQGIQGVQGPQGWQGEEGHKGDKGEDGYQGPQGSQGIQGIQGWQGSGVQGTIGPQGGGDTFYSGWQSGSVGIDEAWQDIAVGPQGASAFLMGFTADIDTGGSIDVTTYDARDAEGGPFFIRMAVAGTGQFSMPAVVPQSGYYAGGHILARVMNSEFGIVSWTRLGYWAP